MFCRTLFITLFAIFTIFSNSIIAQDVQIRGVHMGGFFLDDQNLFDGVLLSNTTNEIQKVEIKGVLSDESGRKLIEITARVSVPQGENYLENIENINSKDYTGVLLDYMKTTGVIPQSLLTFCVEITENGVMQDNSCFTQSSFISNELNLQYPYNQEQVNSLRPSLFWGFTGDAPDVTYNLVLKKKGTAKNNTEGFNFGQIVFRVNRVTGLILDYPNETPDLEQGEEYLWQVEAYLQGISLGKTDIWEFKVGAPLDISSLPISTSFIDIDKVKGEPFLYVLGEIRLQIIESKRPGVFSYKITKESKKNKKGKTLGKDELKINFGENYYNIDLTEKYYLLHNKKYTMEIKRTGVKDLIKIHFIYFNPDYIK